MMLQVVALFAGVVLSYIGVRGLRGWAERHRILDTPNERSSHSRPTPHGGGLAIVLVTLVTGWLIYYQLSSPSVSWLALLGYTVGAALIAAISWLDDLQTLPRWVRFTSHSAGAILIIICSGYWGVIIFPLLGQFKLGPLGLPITFFWIVGLTNAYNFMDGIDGIAGGQAVLAGLGWATIGILMDLPFVGTLGALLAATSLGFLFHNWPPARIFMGDVGSAFLGYSFACLAIMGANSKPSLGIVGVLLVWPFVFDTIFTFFRRLKNRENVFSAHRSHLYQRLVISGYSHRAVTLIYMGLDVLGLLFALLFLLKNRWTDLFVIITLLLSCFGLWGFTVIREQTVLQTKNSNGALEEKLI